MPNVVILAGPNGPAARRHATYGVTDRDLHARREALMRAFDGALGEQFTPEARQAWSELCELAAAVMRRAAARAVVPSA